MRIVAILHVASKWSGTGHVENLQLGQLGLKLLACLSMRCVILLLSSGLLWTTPASAKHWHDDDDHWKKHAHNEGDEEDRHFDHSAGGCYFQPHEMRVISGYYAPRFRNLPPGLQKKLYRGGHLPPGWEGRVEPIPVIVDRQLAPVPVGYRRGYIDGYALVYNSHTRVVIDVFAVFRPR
jgi:hypothetical protein